MTAKLDRSGIFISRLIKWFVKEQKADSMALCITCQFEPLFELEKSDEGTYSWLDWSAYEPHEVWGDYYIIKKDGTPNAVTIRQLTQSLGWGGDLNEIVAGLPKETEVQVKVEENEWPAGSGKITYRAAWMNPRDYVPDSMGAAPEDVAKLQNRFGSVLRATVAAENKPAIASKPAAPPATNAAPAQPVPGAKPASKPKAPPKAKKKGDDESTAPLPVDPEAYAPSVDDTPF